MPGLFRRSACAITVAFVGVLAGAAPALAQECPGGVGRIGGVCSTPTPSPTPTNTQRPRPTYTPRPTQTNTPRPTQTSTPPQPRPTATLSLPTQQPTAAPTGPQGQTPPPLPPMPSDYPTTYPTFSEPPPYGSEERPPFDTNPVASAPSTAPEQGAGLQVLTLLFAAGTLAVLLVRARVRRWMIGI